MTGKHYIQTAILSLVFTFTSLSLLAPAQQVPGSGTTDVEESEEVKKLKKKLNKLQHENNLFEQKLQNELQSIKKKQKRLKEELDLSDLQQKKELSEIERKKKRIESELGLKSAEKKQELSTLKNKIKELKTELELARKKTKKAIQEAQNQKKKIESELDLEKTKKKSELSDLKLKLQETELKQQLAQLETKLMQANLQKKQLEQKIELAKIESEKAEMDAEISLRQTRQKWKSEVSKPIDYIQNPLQNDTLYITDRRVRLDGPIISETGDWVSKRLHYFNNQSEDKPIFIIINESPGGSVMEGFRIIKTMNSIDAPVFVVVKERAASMAAGITALADRSFAYPNAIILHHEIQASMGGSLKENEAKLEMMQKWFKRVAGPVAEKMNMSLEEFRKQMYEENPNGNWQEFATEAKDLNWVDDIIKNIQDVGVREEPSDEPPSPSVFFMKDDKKGKLKKDDQGRYYRKLPPLRPFDFYYMFDPNNFYRW